MCKSFLCAFIFPRRHKRVQESERWNKWSRRSVSDQNIDCFFQSIGGEWREEFIRHSACVVRGRQVTRQVLSSGMNCTYRSYGRGRFKLRVEIKITFIITGVVVNIHHFSRIINGLIATVQEAVGQPVGMGMGTGWPPGDPAFSSGPSAIAQRSGPLSPMYRRPRRTQYMTAQVKWCLPGGRVWGPEL